MRRKLTLSLAAGMLAIAVPALAHHSFAMFDPNKVVVLKGEVSEFRWVNPHVALFVAEGGSADPARQWSVELTSPGNLKRRGWNRAVLKRGDKVEVEINPLRDGRHGGGFRSVKLVDTGQVLTARLVAIEQN